MFLNNNNQCQTCIPPCSYCSSALLCNSCLTGYLLYNNTQCVGTCPQGTYAFTSYCATCGSTCQTCTGTSNNCSSCASGQYLYLSGCYSTCPTPTYPYQGTCTTCV
jgi:proprotein convertase subtilisin/kexin type 5